MTRLTKARRHAEAKAFDEWLEAQPDHVVVGAVSPSFMRRAMELGGGLYFKFVPSASPFSPGPEEGQPTENPPPGSEAASSGDPRSRSG